MAKEIVINVSEILSYLKSESFKYDYCGDAALTISGFCPVSEVTPNSITWIREIDAFDLSSVANPSSLLIVVNEHRADGDIDGYNFIVVDDPRTTFFEILKKFF